jgi:serine-type D-Ala-D-Ala carboxypeptidase/endopeptidase (penicillin-binding protein 4)
MTPIAPPAPICPADLPDRVNQIIDQPQFTAARWGILVQTLDAAPSQRQTLVEHDRQKFFIPASNAKLLTTAAALLALGPEYRIRTSLFGTAQNLELIGHGDPSLTDRQLTQLAQQLKQRSITQIPQLTLNDRYFTNNPNPDWAWDDLQTDYGAIAHSLSLNLNYHRLSATPQALGQPLKLTWSDPTAIAGWTIDNQTQTVAPTQTEFLTATRDLGTQTLIIRGQLRQGGSADTIDLAVLNPTAVFRDRLQTAFAAEKITIHQIRLATTPPPAAPELAFVESPPIAKLIYQTNQESDNLYAESLLQTIGTIAQQRHPSQFTAEDTTTTAGLKTLAQTLETIGVDRSGHALVDGSGLARRNLITPTALVQTLQGMATQPASNAFQTSLPIAAQSGTLTNRFRGTAAAGIVQAKTGTIAGVAALSGYVQPKNHRPLAFSILLNQSPLPAATNRESIDAIVRLLAQLKTCPTPPQK